jgi:hypothetical protein
MQAAFSATGSERLAAAEPGMKGFGLMLMIPD